MLHISEKIFLQKKSGPAQPALKHNIYRVFLKNIS